MNTAIILKNISEFPYNSLSVWIVTGSCFYCYMCILDYDFCHLTFKLVFCKSYEYRVVFLKASSEYEMWIAFAILNCH